MNSSNRPPTVPTASSSTSTVPDSSKTVQKVRFKEDDPRRKKVVLYSKKGLPHIPEADYAGYAEISLENLGKTDDEEPTNQQIRQRNPDSVISNASNNPPALPPK